MVNPPLKPEPPLKPWGGRTCPSAPGPPARSVHVTRLALARRSETTTKRARDEVPSRNLRISSLPAKVVLRWVMVASSAKNDSAESPSWRLRAISKAAITEAGSAVACAVAIHATTPLTISPATPAPNASHSLSMCLSGQYRPRFETRGESAADLAHRARGALERRTLVDLVLQLLVADCLGQDVRQIVVAGSGPQRPAQVPLVDRKQARADLSIGGEPNAIARAAERLRHRVDEAELADAVAEREPSRGAAGFGRHGHHGHEVALDDRLDLVAAQHTLALPVAVGIERHELDEADHVRLAARQLRERDHFDFGEIAHGDDVHLDRRDARIAFELFETGQHFIQPATAGDLVEAVVLQCVQADVDALQARLGQRSGQRAQQEAIGGQAQAAHWQARHALDQLREPRPQRRFTARQADLFDPQLDGHPGDALDLVKRQYGVALEPLHTLLGHAVDAAEVAPVCDRDAQIADAPTVAVDQTPCTRHVPRLVRHQRRGRNKGLRRINEQGHGGLTPFQRGLVV